MTPFERIKKLAKERGYSLTKLNDTAGLGTNSIYHWRTKTPSTASLQKVADVLGVSVDYLLGNSDNLHVPANAKLSATEEKVGGLFRKYTKENNLSEQEKEELAEDLDDYIAMRAKRLRAKKNGL